MTEQTDGAEALAELIAADTDEPMWSAVVIAKHILSSDWLAAREAAAEARGARYALLDAAEDCIDIAFEQNEDVRDWLKERAAARGVEGGAFDKALTETRSEYREALDRLADS